MESLPFIDCPDRAVSRRTLLKAGLLATTALVLPTRSMARVLAPLPTEKTVSLYNIHTGESISKAIYWAEGEFVPETLQEINYLLRDYRTGEVVDMEPRLFDLLFSLRRKLGAREPFHIISGYRSPQTNAMLRRSSSGVARHSLHMEGKAADIRLPGVELAQVRKAALSLRRGGVGYYPASDFVHVDTGRVRHW